VLGRRDEGPGKGHDEKPLSETTEEKPARIASGNPG
jgi:hypothetical protein